MQLDQEFSVDTLPQSNNSFEPLPAGWYDVSISEAVLKNTKAGTGQYIAVKYDVTGPTHAGRCVFGNLNIRNPNPKAEEIGNQQLGELMRAIGLARVTDTDQFIGGVLQVKLSVKRDENYGDGNEVKGFRASGQASAPAAPKFAPPAQQSPAPAQRAAAAPPWAK
jgi:hypothetical protein